MLEALRTLPLNVTAVARYEPPTGCAGCFGIMNAIRLPPPRITPPSRYETAIEVPYRLYLSPDHRRILVRGSGRRAGHPGGRTRRRLRADERDGASVPGAGPRVLRAHESLFIWNGWSLGAPRYGNTILSSDSPDPDDPTEVGAPSNAPVTQFKMEATFTPRPKSLPRLRFGYSYRLRVRAVDLAGNSVFTPDDAAFTVTQTEVTPEVKYRRFEPITPPMVMLQAAPIEGESLERLVVRSRFDDPAASIEAQQTARHIVPPKTSQLMAEHHRKFDAPMVPAADAAYDLASREAGSLTHRVIPGTGDREPIPGAIEIVEPPHSFWVQTNDSFDVAYLPEPYARGVLLLGLPGMNAPDEIIEPGPPIVNKIPFRGTWPDPKPFRLRVSGIAAGAVPATPAWDEINGVLDVQIPQGETYTVRISSYFHATDLENMAVWKWTAETAVPNLNNLRMSAIAGRNWLHLPFRTLVLVHATQQPLAVPRFDTLASQKNFGDTIATLDGRFIVDAKSTGKVDTHTAWQDPFDDMTKPAFDETTDFVVQEMELAEFRLIDPKDDEVDFTEIKHPVGDTKYHLVTYTPVGSTRFREYFPTAITDVPENLIRPATGEAPIPTTIDVLNSARPDAPKPLYIVPLFEWERTGTPDSPKSSRRCGGLRVYMNRPWYSSGAGELLGVTLKPVAVPFGSDEAEVLKKFTSEWGMDPLWPAAATFPLFPANFHRSGRAADDGAAGGSRHGCRRRRLCAEVRLRTEPLVLRHPHRSRNRVLSDGPPGARALPAEVGPEGAHFDGGDGGLHPARAASRGRVRRVERRRDRSRDRAGDRPDVRGRRSVPLVADDRSPRAALTPRRRRRDRLGTDSVHAHATLHSRPREDDVADDDHPAASAAGAAAHRGARGGGVCERRRARRDGCAPRSRGYRPDRQFPRERCQRNRTRLPRHVRRRRGGAVISKCSRGRSCST